MDVEGIIIPKRRYLFLQAIKKLSFFKTLVMIFYGFLYEIHVFTLEKSLRNIYRFFKGMQENEFLQIFETITIIPGINEVIQKLKENGYKIALISSGIPDFLVESLAQKIQADYAYGVELEVIDNKITGNISGDVIKKNGKANVLSKLLQEGGYSRQNCIVIADDRNNMSMFPLASVTIGYNPDYVLAIRCDYAVKGDVQEIIPFFDINERPKHNVTKNYTFRECIHLGSYLIPVLCHFFHFENRHFIVLITLVTIIYVFSEVARIVDFNFPLLTKVTQNAVIGEEKWGFATSPIFFALGIILPLIIWNNHSFKPPETGYSAITILTLGDGTAKIVGKSIGKKVLPYNKTKKIEGTIAGIVAAFIGSLLFVSPNKALIASIITMLIEGLPSPINDNITIPIIAGIVITL
jgi:HAD superfamily phosphoserine phosphatase-like hydrolase